MKIAIWGCGQMGQYVRQCLKASKKYEAVCYGANQFRDGLDLPVYSDREIVKKLGNNFEAVWIAVKSYYDLGDIIRQLRKSGLTSITIVRPELWSDFLGADLSLNIDELVRNYTYSLDIEEKAVVTKIEYHVCDHCNLNCVGCSHFAPIFKGSFADFDVFQRDVERLAECFTAVLRFRLMGGEPFLCQELDRFVDCARKNLPLSNLEIVTNGLLIRKTPEKIWDSIRNNDAILNISLYPPTNQIKDEISEFLNARNVAFSFGSGLEQYNDTGVIEEFHKVLTLSEDHDYRKSAQHCFGSKCHYLRDGKISKCAFPLLASHINDKLGTNYQVSWNDYVDIYDLNLKPWDMVERLEDATPFCRYCIGEKPVRFAWQLRSTTHLSDYLVDEP